MPTYYLKYFKITYKGTSFYYAWKTGYIATFHAKQCYSEHQSQVKDFWVFPKFNMKENELGISEDNCTDYSPDLIHCNRSTDNLDKNYHIINFQHKTTT